MILYYCYYDNEINFPLTFTIPTATASEVTTSRFVIIFSEGGSMVVVAFCRSSAAAAAVDVVVVAVVVESSDRDSAVDVASDVSGDAVVVVAVTIAALGSKLA